MGDLTSMLGQIVFTLAVFAGATLVHWGVNGSITHKSRLLLGICLVLFALVGLILIVFTPVQMVSMSGGVSKDLALPQKGAGRIIHQGYYPHVTDENQKYNTTRHVP